MDEQQAAAVRGDVHHLVANFDAAERDLAEVPAERIVIAGYVDDFGAFARLAQYLLHHVVVRLRPEPSPLELPAVDDVPEEIEIRRFGVAQEFEQQAGLAGCAAQMEIRYPDRAEAELATVSVFHGSVRVARSALRRPGPPFDETPLFADGESAHAGMSISALC